MISFIVPINQDRLYMLEGLTYNIRKCYQGNEYEIVIVEQNNDEPFKLGQLRNIGFKKSSGNTIAIIDADIRFIEKIDFEEMINRMKRPFVPWSYLITIIEDDFKNPIITDEKLKRPGHGGCIVFKRLEFEQSGGYSNLLIGWGAEDSIISIRCPLTKLGMEIYHVSHKKQSGKFGVNSKATEHNQRMYNSDSQRDKMQDGYKQTIFDEIVVSDSGTIKHYIISNIRVNNDFKYMDIYNEMRALES